MKSLLTCLLVFAPLVLSGCGMSEQEKLADEMVNIMKDINKVLDGVTDEASAKAASDKLDPLLKRFKEIVKEAEALEDESVPKKYETKMKEEEGKLEANINRISANPEAALIIGFKLMEIAM